MSEIGNAGQILSNAVISLNLGGTLAQSAWNSGSGESYDASAAQAAAAQAAAAQSSAAAAASSSSNSYTGILKECTIEFGSTWATNPITNKILTLECQIKSTTTSTYKIRTINPVTVQTSDKPFIKFTSLTPSSDLYATPSGFPLVLQAQIDSVTLDTEKKCYAQLYFNYQTGGNFYIQVNKMGLSDPAT